MSAREMTREERADRLTLLRGREAARKVVRMDLPLQRRIAFAIYDPGAITPRGDNYAEPLHQWQARAISYVLPDTDAMAAELASAQDQWERHASEVTVRTAERDQARAELAARPSRAQVLREAAEVADSCVPLMEGDSGEFAVAAGALEGLAIRFRRMADEAGKDSREGESTQPAGYPPALPWAKQLDADDLEGFLADCAAAAAGDDDLNTLAEVERAIGRWRAIGEANTALRNAPGPDAESEQPAEECSCMPHRKYACGHCDMDLCQDCGLCSCGCDCAETESEATS